MGGENEWELQAAHKYRVFVFKTTDEGTEEGKKFILEVITGEGTMEKVGEFEITDPRKFVGVLTGPDETSVKGELHVSGNSITLEENGVVIVLLVRKRRRRECYVDKDCEAKHDNKP